MKLFDLNDPCNFHISLFMKESEDILFVCFQYYRIIVRIEKKF